MKELVSQAVEYINSKTDIKPKIGIILGSGLGAYGETLEEQCIIKYQDIPNIKASTVPGHNGAFVLGKKSNKNVIVMQGRLHYYEGYSLDDIVFPLRVMKQLGIEKLIITNAAGGVNLDFNPGDLMLIKDHINLTGINVLRGQEALEFGVRFPSMSEPYDKKMISLAAVAAKESNILLRKGIYFYTTGPSFETASEIKAIRALGGDAVGMSTVHEVTCAVQMGIKVLGISCISNMACGVLNKPLTHSEVLETTARVKTAFITLLDNIISKI